MKLTFLFVLIALSIAAVGASSATAQRAPCSQKSSVRALPTPEFGLQLYVVQRCGGRVGLRLG
jgi:hypothetical protein